MEVDIILNSKRNAKILKLKYCREIGLNLNRSALDMLNMFQSCAC